MLACQRDSQLRALSTELVDCHSSPEGEVWVELADTVLYPEGGGQPADWGLINQVPVSDVQRQADGRILHRVQEAIPLGPVEVQVNWKRRLDHMQQHTGQHLLSAIAQDRLGLSTLSFHLGEQDSHIELDGPPGGDAIRLQLEEWVNQEIQAARTVHPQLASQQEFQSLDVRSRGLPAGHQGDIRLIVIDGIDINTCGGTHVINTAQLGVLQLVSWERYKSSSRLHFLVGERVRTALHQSHAHQQALNRALQGGPEAHIELIEKISSREKQTARTLKKRSEELASLQAQLLLNAPGPLVHHHQEDGDMGYLRSLAQRGLHTDDLRVLLLTAADPSGEGVFLLAGEANAVEAIGPTVAELVAGRGGGRGGRYQGKGSRVQLTPEHLSLLQSMLKS